MYKENWTQTWPMGSEIYPEVHENPRAFFNNSSPILLEPLAHGSGDWFLPREDCITLSLSLKCMILPEQGSMFEGFRLSYSKCGKHLLFKIGTMPRNKL